MTVAIDWGSTSFRAFHFDNSGELLNKYQGEHGIKQAQGLSDEEREAWFQNILVKTCAEWIEVDRKAPPENKETIANAWLSGSSERQVDVVLSGMVTSRNGWIETPYINCPLVLDDLRKHSVRYEFEDIRLAFLPGVSVTGLQPDVMRGEELQLIGVELNSADGGSGVKGDIGNKGNNEKQQGHAIFVLPGTHSKWVNCRCHGGDAKLTIESFHTCPSGELYDTLLKFTLIGGLALHDNWEEAAFLSAVKTGFTSQRFLSSLFAARSGVLLESLDASAVPAYLSGLLIGREIREGIDELAGNAVNDQITPTAGTSNNSAHIPGIVLIGEPQLCGLYLQALEHLNITARLAGEDMSETGFRKLLGY